MQPFSDGSRQSLWPAKPAAFTALSQSQTVVIAPKLYGSTLHVPLEQTLHPIVPPVECATQVAAAAAFGWHRFDPLHGPQHPAHE